MAKNKDKYAVLKFVGLTAAGAAIGGVTVHYVERFLQRREAGSAARQNPELEDEFDELARQLTAGGPSAQPIGMTITPMPVMPILPAMSAMPAPAADPLQMAQRFKDDVAARKAERARALAAKEAEIDRIMSGFVDGKD